MKAYLMFRDRDFDPDLRLIVIASPFPRRDVLPPGPWEDLPPLSQALFQDLQLEPILQAMAGEDPFLYEVSRRAILSGATLDRDTTLYRQGVLRDGLKNPTVLRDIYRLAIEANEAVRKSGGWLGSNYPSGILGRSIEAMKSYMEALRRLRDIAKFSAPDFNSEGFSRLFEMLRSELGDAYFAEVAAHLKRLRFRYGVPISAEVGPDCKARNYVLRMPQEESEGWLSWLFGAHEESYTLTIAPRDEAGATALGELRDRGLALVADALGQSVDHIHSFFDMLRTELAFYIACLNLNDRLADLGAPTCLPDARPQGARATSATELYDLALALGMGRRIVGNTVDAGATDLIVVTGANRGGKTTFLRSLGQAQILMQAGMLVPAEAFAADVARGIFTHFKREEDASMSSGKLDEELSRMSGIIDQLVPDALVLFNEAFAATNEREGSEIARQVTEALETRNVKQVHVSHLYTFSSALCSHPEHRYFLRADPGEGGGSASFRLHPGPPLSTSYGADVYRRYFTDAA
jgi:DNA mismatch repair ATPase MutS